MRKIFLIFLMLFTVAIVLPAATNAQTYVKRYVDRNGRVRYVRVKKPNFYQRHRNASNIAIGTGAGAILGGIIGGKKGALIGAGAGAGGSALYTYKIRPKKKRYYKVRNY